jgi:hypothetical protein
MTNKERLISLLGFVPANNDAIDGALLDAGMDGGQTYDPATRPEDVTTIKTCAIEVLLLLLSTADTITDNNGGVGNSIKYDRKAVEQRIYDLRVDLGLITDKPTISFIHPW